ncbi:unnamed protein product [Hymenolepis diminuta]|uniref:Uncharacterized protein n=1 Tax=Hymenolepis diminuta TaxID=6216 RepID=A0A564Z939_HYMDI|nr:unnamed protein product [Hymenolepis diminuta]
MSISPGANSNLLQDRETRMFNKKRDLIDHLSFEGTCYTSDDHPTNIRSSHFQYVDIVENITIIEMSLQRKWPLRRLLVKIFPDKFNKKCALIQTRQNYGFLMQVNDNSRKFVNLSVNVILFELQIDIGCDIIIVSP